MLPYPLTKLKILSLYQNEPQFRVAYFKYVLIKES